MLLVYTNDDPDNLFMIVYDGYTPAVEDDYVDIKGVLGKRMDYDTNIGGTNTVPAMKATNIQVTGHEDDSY